MELIGLIGLIGLIESTVLPAAEFSRHRQVVRNVSLKHHGGLEDERHAASKPAHRVFDDRNTVEENVSSDRIIEPVEESEKRRLPTAGWTDQDRNQMPRDRNVDVLKYRTAGPFLTNASKLKRGGHLTCPAPSTTNRCEVNSSRPIGPYACTREVLIPISAPMPS